MRDFVVAVGLIFALEGLLFAGFPAAMRRALTNAIAHEPSRLRVLGLASAVMGVLIVWIARWGAF